MVKQLAPISIRLTPALLARLDAYCTTRRRKRGEMIRMLVEDAVAADVAASSTPPRP